MSGKRYTSEDLKDNFIRTIKENGTIPLFNDFKKYSEISLNTYASRLKLVGKVYDEVVKFYCNNDDYLEYLDRRNKHKTSVGKITGSLSRIYPDDVLETNLRYIFDTYMFKYSRYPSRRLFDNISMFDSRHYRKRYHMSWTEICKSFGYTIANKNIEETICLNMCAELLNSKFKSQETWDWLIGVGGKNMYCDGYFKNLSVNIEYDGSSHRISISKFGGDKRLIRTKENDKLKEKLLLEHGIKTIRIDSRLKWYEKDTLTKLLNL